MNFAAARLLEHVGKHLHELSIDLNLFDLAAERSSQNRVHRV
jgi:hypothetical protein